MKRALIVLAAVVALGIAALSFSSSASAGSSSGSVLPKIGHYEGRDTNHRHIRFYYGSHGRVINFRVEHTNFPPADVHGDKWHHTCHNNHCTRGHWVKDTEVHGHWNISHAGGDVFFTAHWVSH